jgi:heat shock protein HslJ
MTDTPDPFRSLDGHEPPADWDAVVARAERPADVEPPAPTLLRSRRLMLAAAALLVVVGIGAAMAVTSADRGGRQHVAARGASGSDPADIWGHRWNVTSITHDGRHRPVLPARDGALALDARSTGMLAFNGCNGAGGAAHLDGSTVVPDGDWFHTAMGCIAEDGKPDGLMDQDQWLDDFLRAGPTVSLDGDHLTLTHGADVIQLVDAATVTTTTETPPSATRPDPTTTSIPSTTTTPQSETTATHPDVTTTTLDPNTPMDDIPEPANDPTLFLDHDWKVVAVAQNGGPPDFENGDPHPLDGIIIHSKNGFVTVEGGCNGAGGSMKLEGDRLVKVGTWVSTAMGCVDAPGHRDRMKVDAWFDRFLAAGPTLTFDPARLTQSGMRSGYDVITVDPID